MTSPQQTFCWNCWRDWKDEYLDLAPWEQEQFDAQNPRINPNDFARGKCPFCGTRYDEGPGDWFEELFGEDAWADEPDYDRADWEEQQD